MIGIETKLLTMRIMNMQEAVNSWPEIHKHIEHALDFSPDITIADVKIAVEKNLYQVIAVERDDTLAGVVVLKLQEVKGNKIAWVLAMGGRWICHSTSIAQFKEFLRGLGVNKLQGIARPSVARLWTKLGVTPLYTVMETNI